MIDIKDKRNCSGCSACESICPTGCIAMKSDNDGFRYPYVDKSRCINCGLCEKTCPFVHPWEPINCSNVFAMRSKQHEDLEKSSSGAIFFKLANDCFSRNGYVVGAIYDNNWNVCHHISRNIEDLTLFQGSKYVQSEIRQLFPQIKDILSLGNQVLFSGTPCQVAGLKHYLRKEYNNLLTVEVICHGTPSPKAWQSYLRDIDIKPTNVNMRDRSLEPGYSISIAGNQRNGRPKMILEHSSSNIYLRGFLANLYLRPSCFACKAKNLRSRADITLGDFWTIRKFSKQWTIIPELVLANSPKGLDAINRLNGCDQETIEVGNISEIGNYLIVSAKYTKKNNEFFSDIDSENFSPLVQRLLKKPFLELIKNKIYYLLAKIYNFIRH